VWKIARHPTRKGILRKGLSLEQQKSEIKSEIITQRHVVSCFMSTLRIPCLVLFDGACCICNGIVEFMQPRNPEGTLYFVPSQSEAGRELMRRERISEEAVALSLHVIEEGGIFTRSTAVLRITSHLSFPWRLVSVFKVIPPFLRDGFYMLVSANRYRWFGKRSECIIPTPEQRARFLQTREELEEFEKRQSDLRRLHPE
jgi:predicted DCC family thiol-disulfide oxidoreductase YuxK